MTKSTTTLAANRPAHEIRVAALRATIWHNKSDNGEWYSVTITRCYKVGEQWKDTTQFGRDDLPVVSGLANAAFGWIEQQRDAA